MLPAGFEPAIPASERPLIYAFNSMANGIGYFIYLPLFLWLNSAKLIHTCPFLYTEPLRILRTIKIPFLFAFLLKMRCN